MSMLPARADALLLWNACGYAALAIACAVALTVERTAILGVHPALKPLKFAVALALFFATLAVVLPSLGTSPGIRAALRWTLVITMAAEIVAIVAQALRGTTSHFNTATPLDRAVVAVMLGAILVMTIAMAVVAVLATARPLLDDLGHRLPASQTLAWRAGLWIFQLAAVTGFAMGGRGRHTVGGEDGGLGLPVVNWSLAHGDLRVPHFLAMHALQVLPLIAWAVGSSTTGVTITSAAVASYAAGTLWTLVRAFSGQPPW